MLSKTQIDKLGERLREGDIAETDLRMLDEYRRSFSEGYNFVVGAIRNELNLEPTGRPAKSTTAIVEKLRRESIRLTQVQDIAGCRLLVSDVVQQERVADSVKQLFANAILVDRRKEPSHGYRAIHLIVAHEGKKIEIQIRTSLQHAWAELSEKIADVVDPGVKYGGGSDGVRELLAVSSRLIADEEALELDLSSTELALSRLLARDDLEKDKQKKLTTIRGELDDLRRQQSTAKAESSRILATALDLFPAPERKA